MINKLRARIDKLITKQLFEEQNFDEILDNRDNEVFDSKWIYTYNAVGNKKKHKYISDENNSITDEIREKVFRYVYDYTEYSDLAAYILNWRVIYEL